MQALIRLLGVALMAGMVAVALLGVTLGKVIWWLYGTRDK